MERERERGPAVSKAPLSKTCLAVVLVEGREGEGCCDRHPGSSGVMCLLITGVQLSPRICHQPYDSTEGEKNRRKCLSCWLCHLVIMRTGARLWEDSSR